MAANIQYTIVLHDTSEKVPNWTVIETSDPLEAVEKLRLYRSGGAYCPHDEVMYVKRAKDGAEYIERFKIIKDPGHGSDY